VIGNKNVLAYSGSLKKVTDVKIDRRIRLIVSRDHFISDRGQGRSSQREPRSPWFFGWIFAEMLSLLYV